jgi:hypothetical protein
MLTIVVCPGGKVLRGPAPGALTASQISFDDGALRRRTLNRCGGCAASSIDRNCAWLELRAKPERKVKIATDISA